jgi:hypothetical protein
VENAVLETSIPNLPIGIDGQRQTRHERGPRSLATVFEIAVLFCPRDLQAHEGLQFVYCLFVAFVCSFPEVLTAEAFESSTPEVPPTNGAVRMIESALKVILTVMLISSSVHV